MDKKYIERPAKMKNVKNEKNDRKQKSINVDIPKKYEQFWKKSVKESGLSNLQFVIKLTNEYVEKHNFDIGYIPMPDKCGRKEGYNK